MKSTTFPRYVYLACKYSSRSHHSWLQGASCANAPSIQEWWELLNKTHKFFNNSNSLQVFSLAVWVTEPNSIVYKNLLHLLQMTRYFRIPILTAPLNDITFLNIHQLWFKSSVCYLYYLIDKAKYCDAQDGWLNTFYTDHCHSEIQFMHLSILYMYSWALCKWQAIKKPIEVKPGIVES